MKKQRSRYSESELFVTDTHPLLWHLTEDESLSNKAEELFKRDLEFLEIIEDISNSSNYLWYPLDLEVIMKCHELIEIPELHDRIIVATAILLEAKLITKDPKIVSSKQAEVVW